MVIGTVTYGRSEYTMYFDSLATRDYLQYILDKGPNIKNADPDIVVDFLSGLEDINSKEKPVTWRDIVTVYQNYFHTKPTTTVTYGGREYTIDFDSLNTWDYLQDTLDTDPNLKKAGPAKVVDFLLQLQTSSVKAPLTKEGIDEAYRKYFLLDLTPRLSDQSTLTVGTLTVGGPELDNLPQPPKIKEGGSVGTFEMGVGASGSRGEEQQKDKYKITIRYDTLDESGNKVTKTFTFELNCDEYTGKYAEKKAAQLVDPNLALRFLSALEGYRSLTKADVDDEYRKVIETVQKKVPVG